MKYQNIPELKVIIAQVEAPLDSYHTFKDIIVKKNYAIVPLGTGSYDGEIRTLLCIENVNKTVVAFVGNVVAPDCDENAVLLMTQTGQTFTLVWCKEKSSWYIIGTGCTVLTKNEYTKWEQDPTTIDIDYT